MREGRASTTAEAVAFLRGVASLPRSATPEVDDPFASTLLAGPLRVALEVARTVPGAGAVFRAASLGLFDHIALRTLTIDDAVRAAVVDGARQLCVLGAGLDARAYRMPELASVTVFEVDFPATQKDKRARLAGVSPVAREVRFVGVDFERDSLHDRLTEVGHDSTTPTLWIWEGVTPYLVREAIVSTLDVIAARSCVGSTVVVSYVTPGLARIALGPSRALTVPTVLAPAVHASFAILGEGLRSTLDPQEMASLLEARRFSMMGDTGSREWARIHPPRTRASRFETLERVAVARRP